MSKKERIPLKGGAEFDALTSARKYYVYLTNSGVAIMTEIIDWV